MLYLLGILTGLLLAIICMLSVRKYQIPIERISNQIENKFKEKGALFVEDDGVEDLKAWLEKLPEEKL